MSSFPKGVGPGVFVPTTNVWDVTEIEDVDVNSSEFKELLVRLYQNLNNMSLAINLKTSGYLPLDEFVNSELFFPNPELSSTSSANPVFRQVFTKVINFGALPNNTTKSVPHGLDTSNNNVTFTYIGATTNDPVAKIYVPLPFASQTPGDTVEVFADADNVNINSKKDRTSFTITYVVLKYIKQ